MGALRLYRFQATRGNGRRHPLTPGMAVALKRAHRGDPGFLDFLKGVAGAAGRVAGFIADPIGSAVALGTQAASVLTTKRSTPPSPPGTALVPQTPSPLPAIRGRAVGAAGGPGLGGSLSVGGPMGFNLTGGATLSGGAGAISLDDAGTDDTTGTTAVQATAVCNLKGYHFNKRGYFTKAGYVPAHSKCVKNRRRNALNPRALHHSVSRLLGFQHAAGKVEKSLAKLTRRSSAGRSVARAARRPGHKAGCGCVVCRR